MKFPLGQTVMTIGVKSHLEENNFPQSEISKLITKHVSGDWGIVSKEDQEMNELAIKDGDRILSAYMLGDTKVWVITEADRSATTVLLPNEY